MSQQLIPASYTSGARTNTILQYPTYTRLKNRSQNILMAPKRKNEKVFQKENINEAKEIKYYFNEGKACLEKGKTTEDFSQAITHLNTAIQKSSNCQNLNPNNIYHIRGQVYSKLRDYERAQRDYLQAINLSDEKSKVMYFHSLIKCKLETNKGEKTLEIQDVYRQFERAVEFSNNKSDGPSYLNIANTNKLMGKIPDAIKNYGNSIKHLKNNELFEAYFNRGICYRQIDQIENSIDDFLKAAELRKDEPYVQYRLGLNYLDVEDFEEARGRFDRAIELNTKEPMFYSSKALALYLNYEYQSALNESWKALELFEEAQTAECWYNQANTLIALGQLSKASESLQKAIKYVGKDASLLIKIHYAEGLVNERIGSSSALSNFSHCLKLIKENTHKLFLPTLYHLAMNQHRNKLLKEAIASFTRILENDCYDKCVYENRGKVYLETEMFEEALKDFDKVSELEDDYPDIYFYKGLAKNNLRRTSEAIQDFFYALELGSTNIGVYNGIGESYLISKKYEKALFYSDIALEKNPNNEEFLVQRSKAYLEINQHDKAIGDLTKAIEQKPNNSTIYYRRGLALYKNKDYEAAIKDLYKAYELKPSDIIEPDIHYLLGISFANFENFEKAIEPLTKAINLDGKPKYYHERAKCFLLINRNQQALNDLNQVIKGQPNNAYAYFRRAFAYKALKKYDETAEDFEMARKLKPNDPKLIINKKQIYSIQHKKLCDPGEEE